MTINIDKFIVSDLSEVLYTDRKELRDQQGIKPPQDEASCQYAVAVALTAYRRGAIRCVDEINRKNEEEWQQAQEKAFDTMLNDGGLN